MNLKILIKVIEAMDEASGGDASEVRKAIADKLGDDAAYFFNCSPMEIIKLIGSTTMGDLFAHLVELQGS